MKNLLFIILLIITSISLNAQTMSCFEALNIVKYNTNYKQIESYTSLNSEFLTSVVFYKSANKNYYAVVGINYKEYLYASSYNLISQFRQYAYTDQAGEAFHVYIKPHKVNCW
tara:strand:- start:271 stop:609 length:339 start_codon:yes stop_codon:yes gene_type:complete